MRAASHVGERCGLTAASVLSRRLASIAPSLHIDSSESRSPVGNKPSSPLGSSQHPLLGPVLRVDSSNNRSRNISSIIASTCLNCDRSAFHSQVGCQPVNRFAASSGPANKILMSTDESEEGRDSKILFGPWPVAASEVFYSTDLSLAIVNLKPVVPGHVLIISRRVVPRFRELTAEEVRDLWQTAQTVGPKLEAHFGATSLTFAIQDGAQAGQTVPHVHIHILPRRSGDFQRNDEVYDELDHNAKKMKSELDLDKEKRNRTPEEMAAEAKELAALFKTKETEQ
eukprot:TRINITY_DN1560_c0_g1_i1.p1 TRINITY_DN1560_c0_g1~~TRINITY_DN1560_c0_g1_i1.p1  ORF type:complete len:284 (-),score=48.00 TRINITY_DN1560_c0_g1_i1:96-947(-)